MPETLAIRRVPLPPEARGPLPTQAATPGGARRQDASRTGRTPDVEYQRASLALHNLRGAAIALVVAVHAAVAYLASNRATPYPFDRPPYGWLAFPVIDRERWLGFDIFCAWQDAYLMALMFFLAGALSWQSLARQPIGQFLSKRLLRLGVPLIVGLMAVMPAALYPVYRLSAASPSLAEYARQYLALPFTPAGPMWFLWVLIPLTALAALIRAFLPAKAPSLAHELEARPLRAAAVASLIVVAAYAPLALAFTPWRWFNLGPFAIELSRPLLYVVYFLAGFWAGADGLGRGLLRTEGGCARNWRAWAIAASFSLLAWLGLTALVLEFGGARSLPLEIAADIAFALAGLSSVLFALAFCLRFGARGRWPLLGPLSDNALGVYVLHYAPVVWLQYALLRTAWPAPLKAAAVFSGAILSCLAILAAARSLRRLIEGAGRAAQPRLAQAEPRG